MARITPESVFFMFIYFFLFFSNALKETGRMGNVMVGKGKRARGKTPSPILFAAPYQSFAVDCFFAITGAGACAGIRQ